MSDDLRAAVSVVPVNDPTVEIVELFLKKSDEFGNQKKFLRGVLQPSKIQAAIDQGGVLGEAVRLLLTVEGELFKDLFRPTSSNGYFFLSCERRHFGLVELRAFAPLQHRLQQRKKESPEREAPRTPTPHTLALGLLQDSWISDRPERGMRPGQEERCNTRA